MRGLFSCPGAALLGLKLSRVTAGTFAPPSNFFHSHFSSFPARRSLSSPLLCLSLPLFLTHLIPLLIALVSSHINALPWFFFLFFISMSLWLWTLPPRTRTEAVSFFFSLFLSLLLTAVTVSTTSFFFSRPLLFALSRWQREKKPTASNLDVGDVSRPFKEMSCGNRTSQLSLFSDCLTPSWTD